MPFATLTQSKVHYQLEGNASAPVVVLCHSLGSDLRMWDAEVAAIRKHLHVLRYDARGHGQSVSEPGPYTLDQLGGDIVELLDHLSIQRVHVCGISMGGITALWMGVHAAARVLSLMPCCTAARIGTVESWNQRIAQVREGGMESIADAQMERWFTPGFRQSHPEIVSRTRETLCGTSADAYVACCAALQHADLREDIRSIHAPTLVVSGKYDPVTPPAEGHLIQERIPGSSYAEVDGAHLSSLEDPAGFSDMMLQHTLTLWK